jgi:Transmembrane secretion effector
VSSALAYPRLRRILFAYTANRLGSWIGLVALSLAVYDHTHSASRAALPVAGLLLAWQAVPAFVVPVVVARVEASKRRRELSALYFFEGLVTAAIAVLLPHFWLPGLLLLAMLDGTAALAASSLLRAEVARSGREHVLGRPGGAMRTAGVTQGSEDLDKAVQEAERKGNAALNIAFSAAFVGGPVLGGVVTAAFGAPAALLIDVGSFMVCGALLTDMHPHVEEASGNSVRARLNVAWQHINEAPSLRALLATEVVALLFIQAAGPIEVIYTKGTLHAGDRGYGLLVTAWGGGAVLGSIVFARAARQPLGVVLSVGTFALGAAFVGYALAPSLALACVAAAVGGLGNTLEWPALVSLVQRMTPQPLHGRLMGAVESLSALCVAVGLLLGGALVALSSARVAFLIIGLGTAAASTGFVRLTLIGLGPGTTAGPDGQHTVAPQAHADDLLSHEPTSG